uniref:Uncharacterized protein n=1 Tax=Caenorhabditis japonica TaxID=281687 RepID=A0A8R1EG67_CAEJA
MMTEKKPFLVVINSKSRSRNWPTIWNVTFYVILFIPFLLLFIWCHRYSMDRLKSITFIPMTSAQNKELNFFPLFKGVGGEYNYDSLPSCDTVKLAKGVNTTKVWREMKGCGFALLRRFFGNPEAVLPNFVNTVYVCDDVVEMNGYEVKELKNSERSYYSVLPKC